MSAANLSKCKLFMSKRKPLVVQAINLLESGRSLIRISPLIWNTELLGVRPSPEYLKKKMMS